MCSSHLVTGVPILLDGVTKQYGSRAKPAVDHLTLEIPAGSTVMFVGPSGCGKTTTLKMINRLIEPSQGRIVIDGEDVTTMNGDELRRLVLTREKGRQPPNPAQVPAASPEP